MGEVPRALVLGVTCLHVLGHELTDCVHSCIPKPAQRGDGASSQQLGAPGAHPWWAGLCLEAVLCSDQGGKT